MQSKTLSMLLIAVLALAMAGAWLLRPGKDMLPESTASLQVAGDCDVAERACSARGGELHFELQLGPPVRPMEAFDIRLRGTPAADAQISVEFRMIGMDMGLNRYRLERAADGEWRGRAMLPVCTTGRSDWMAQVEIIQGGRRWVAELPFTVARP